MSAISYEPFLAFLARNGIDRDEFSAGPVPRFVRFPTTAAASAVAALLLEMEAELQTDIEVVDYFPSFYRLDQTAKISQLQAFKSGLVYGMDIASCAPGAKLCYLMDLLSPSGTGTVTGVDVSKHRLYTAKSIAQKYGLDRIRLFLQDGTEFTVPPPSRVGPRVIREADGAGGFEGPREWTKPFHASKMIRGDSQLVPGWYDKVLVDAECTHDGSIAHVLKYEAKGWSGFEQEFLDPKRLEGLQKLQQALLERGFQMCRPGGLLVYSTCSFSRKQNEDIVVWFMETHRGRVHVEAVPTAVEGKPWPQVSMDYTQHYSGSQTAYLDKTLRFSPRVSNTSGLFICRFRKLA
ncbi:hypothetical protein HDU91_006602 [Kappamyces sp. JEL0680]|nr:hypothetical protein HDU91_006602 [Kappamyces sp. JEL0680]